MTKQLYPTDLTDSQWHSIKELLPKEKPSLDMRMVVNAIFYVVVGGIKWPLARQGLPRDYPKWKSVYHYFRQWRISGDWRRIHDSLRAQLRRQSGCHQHA